MNMNPDVIFDIPLFYSATLTWSLRRQKRRGGAGNTNFFQRCPRSTTGSRITCLLHLYRLDESVDSRVDAVLDPVNRDITLHLGSKYCLTKWTQLLQSSKGSLLTKMRDLMFPYGKTKKRGSLPRFHESLDALLRSKGGKEEERPLATDIG